MIFALGPLGILTAVVSAIRVRGSPSLRAFIGRAHEAPGNVEIELLSCTSATTSELGNDGGISRVFGKPQIMEIVSWKPTDEDYKFPELHGYFARRNAGIGRMEDAVRLSRWQRPVQRNWSDEAIEKLSVGSPNLSLNVGIRQRPWQWFCAAAVLGLGLKTGTHPYILHVGTQAGTFTIGVLIFAFLASSKFRSSFKPDGKILTIVCAAIGGRGHHHGVARDVSLRSPDRDVDR